MEKERVLPREVVALIDEAAAAFGAAQLCTGDGAVLHAAGVPADPSWGFPVQMPEGEGRLVLPAPARPVGSVLASAIEKLAAQRVSIRDLAATTRRLWAEQNLLFTAGNVLRQGIGESEIVAWLTDRLRFIQRDWVVVALCDGTSVRIAGGERPPGLGVGSVIPPDPVVAGVLARGAPEAFVSGRQRASRTTDPLAFAQGQPVLIAPLRSAEQILGVTVLARPAGAPPFNAEEVKLAQLLSDMASLALTNRRLVKAAGESARMGRELELAAEIQRKLLPPVPARFAEVEVAASCVPAAWVGGDAYLLRELSGGDIMVGILDLTGHGVGASLSLAAFSTRLAMLLEVVTDPADLLALLNDHLVRHSDRGERLATAIIAFVNPRTGAFRVASAGHPPALVRRASCAIETLDEVGMILGVIAGQDYPVFAGILAPADALVMYSDGLIDEQSPLGERAEIERVTSWLGFAEGSAGEMVAAIEAEAFRFSGSASPEDDRTVLVLRRDAAG